MITAVVIRRNMGQSIVFMFWLDAESSKMSVLPTKKGIGMGKKKIQGLSITARKALIKAPYYP